MKLNAKRFLFFTFLVLGTYLVFFFRSPIYFQSSLTDLFPLQINGKTLPKKITYKYTNILNVIVEANSFDIAKEKSDEIFEKLTAAGIKDITYQIPNDILHKSIDYFKMHPASFLSSDTRHLLLNSNTEKVRKKAVEQIQTSWMPLLISLQDDPFLLITDYVQNIQKPSSLWSEKNGVLWREKNGKNYVLVLIKFNQKNVDELIRQVLFVQKLSVLSSSDYKIHLSGAPIHTVQMFERTKSDIFFISVLGILTLSFLTYFLFYRFQSILLVLFNLILAFACGTLSVFLFSSQVHFLTFAFGSSLVGICIDYSFHRFYYSENKISPVLLKNIFYSFLTTICCFIPLLFSDFSLLYQIALFTIGGLCGTFLWVLISPIPTSKNITAVSLKKFRFPFKKFSLICLSVVTIVGLIHLRIDHSPQNLYSPPQALQQEETFFNNLNGNTFSHILLIRGESLQSVLEKEEKIKETKDFFSLSTLLPSLKRQKENKQLIENLYRQEAKNLQTDLELKKTPILKETTPIDEEEFQNHFDFLTEQFLVKTQNEVWSVVPLKDRLTVSDNNVLNFEPTKYLSAQLDLYASRSYKNLFVSFCFLFFILYTIYRKKALTYLVPSLLGCSGTLGILSLCGQAITFFHLLSLFIVIGLSMDYTIFLFCNDTKYKPVLFSFLSSFIGFGLLSFVHFHMIAIMGQTIAFGLLLSFFITLLIKKE